MAAVGNAFALLAGDDGFVSVSKNKKKSKKKASEAAPAVAPVAAAAGAGGTNGGASGFQSVKARSNVTTARGEGAPAKMNAVSRSGADLLRRVQAAGVSGRPKLVDELLKQASSGSAKDAQHLSLSLASSGALAALLETCLTSPPPAPERERLSQLCAALAHASLPAGFGVSLAEATCALGEAAAADSSPEACSEASSALLPASRLLLRGAGASADASAPRDSPAARAEAALAELSRGSAEAERARGAAAQAEALADALARAGATLAGAEAGSAPEEAPGAGAEAAAEALAALAARVRRRLAAAHSLGQGGVKEQLARLAAEHGRQDAEAAEELEAAEARCAELEAELRALRARGAALRSRRQAEERSYAQAVEAVRTDASAAAARAQARAAALTRADAGLGALARGAAGAGSGRAGEQGDLLAAARAAGADAALGEAARRALGLLAEAARAGAQGVAFYEERCAAAARQARQLEELGMAPAASGRAAGAAAEKRLAEARAALEGVLRRARGVPGIVRRALGGAGAGAALGAELEEGVREAEAASLAAGRVAEREAAPLAAQAAAQGAENVEALEQKLAALQSRLAEKKEEIAGAGKGRSRGKSSGESSASQRPELRGRPGESNVAHGGMAAQSAPEDVVVDTSDLFCVDDAKITARDPSAPTRETDEHRLMQRQRQVDFGKNTLGYQRYTATVPKRHRQRGAHPSTPDAHQSCSKRSFDGQIRKWRRQLHDWDPPVAEEGGTAAEQLARPREASDGLPGLENAGPMGQGRDASVVEAHHPRSHSSALSPSASYEFVDRDEAQEDAAVGGRTDPPASPLPAATWPKKESELRSLNALLPRLVQALDRKRSTPEVSALDAQLQSQSRMHKTARTVPSDADADVDYSMSSDEEDREWTRVDLAWRKRLSQTAQGGNLA